MYKLPTCYLYRNAYVAGCSRIFPATSGFINVASFDNTDITDVQPAYVLSLPKRIFLIRIFPTTSGLINVAAFDNTDYSSVTSA